MRSLLLSLIIHLSIFGSVFLITDLEPKKRTETGIRIKQISAKEYDLIVNKNKEDNSDSDSNSDSNSLQPIAVKESNPKSIPFSKSTSPFQLPKRRAIKKLGAGASPVSRKPCIKTSSTEKKIPTPEKTPDPPKKSNEEDIDLTEDLEDIDDESKTEINDLLWIEKEDPEAESYHEAHENTIARLKNLNKRAEGIVRQEEHTITIDSEDQKYARLRSRITNQIMQCWGNITHNISIKKEIILTISVNFNKDGSIKDISAPDFNGYFESTKDQNETENPNLRRNLNKLAQESLNQCTPLTKMPVDLYDQWKTVKFNFHY